MKKLLLICICALLSVGSVYAIEVMPAWFENTKIQSLLPYTDTLITPGATIAAIIQYFILLTGILAVMAITWGGIKFVLSTGDDEKMKKARYTVIYAFVGLVVAGLAYSIVEIITKIEL